MATAQRILIVEDDSGMSALMERVLTGQGYQVAIEPSAERAMTRLERDTFDLILTDLVLGGMGGDQVVRKVREDHPDSEIIVITAHASVDSAIEIMKQGAFDYLRKPLLPEEILHAAQKALEMKELRDEVKALRVKANGDLSQDIIGRSSLMNRLFQRVSRAAQTQAIVLIEGESGTGKELFARALHNESSRRKEPFIAVNCGAIPANLMETELFGHAKGAFTGAHAERKGYFESANRGTLFLDEIGEMELHLQIKLLRVLQENCITRVGETIERPLDVRIVAATNKNLAEAVSEGAFRRDLYYRLRVVHIRIPPLRERKEDLLLLAHAFMRRYSEKYGKQFVEIGSKAAKILQRYDYPGNVRELENIIESVVAIGRGKTIRPAHLKEALGADTYEEVAPVPEDTELPFGDELERVVDRFERNYLDRMLTRYNGKIHQVAEVAKMSRRSVERKMKKYGLKRSNYL